MSILIIDTSYLIYKAYFAYPHLSYQNQPTGAIYGFIKTVLKLITDWQPKILVFTVIVQKKLGDMNYLMNIKPDDQKWKTKCLDKFQ